MDNKQYQQELIQYIKKILEDQNIKGLDAETHFKAIKLLEDYYHNLEISEPEELNVPIECVKDGGDTY